MLPDAYRAVTLGELNPGLVASLALLNPLSAQIDALLGAGISGLQTELSARLSAAVAAQVDLSLAISGGGLDIAASIEAAIAALAALRAAMAMSLDLPSVQLGAGLTATVALAAALKAELAGLQVLIQAALAIKMSTVSAGAALGAHLSAGPFVAVSYSDTSLSALGSWVNSQAQTQLSADGSTILPGDSVFGVLIVCKDPALKAAFGAIISVP